MKKSEIDEHKIKLEDSYEKFLDKGFVLRRSAKYTKFAAGIKGKHYKDLSTTPYNQGATGYVAVVKPHILSFDIDVGNGKVGRASFNNLLDDLNLLEPLATTRTQSGGEHVFYKIPSEYRLMKPTKEAKKRYKHVDMFTGNQIVHPIPHTVYKNDEGEFKVYTWANEYADVMLNDWDDALLQILGEPPKKKEVDDDDDDDYLCRVYQQITADEIEEKLSLLDPNCDYDTWWQLLASAYNIAQNKNEAREIALEWSKGGETFEQSAFDKKWAQFEEGSFGTEHKGGMLINMWLEAKKEDRTTTKDKFLRYAEAIRNSETIDEINDLFKSDDWSADPICSSDEQKSLPAICKNRANEILKASGNRHKYRVDDFKPLVFVKGEVKGLAGIESFFCLEDNKYYFVTNKNKLVPNVQSSSLTTVGQSLKIKGDAFYSHATEKSNLIRTVEKESNYMLDAEVSYVTKQSENPSELDALYVLTNPLARYPDTFEGRMDVIDDFHKEIWNGKAKHLILLMGLTMRFKEEKLNKVHLVAPSDAGKSAMLKNMNVADITMDRLLKGMSSDKGVGKDIITPIKDSGLLLIDETNKPLTEEIKNMDTHLSIDQFGYGGTQRIKLHFTIMTSTHKKAIRAMSDELYNRLLCVELHADEMKHSIKNSPLYREIGDEYTKVLTAYNIWYLKDSLTNSKYNKNDLIKLHDRYRLENNNDIDDILTDVTANVISDIKQLMTDDANDRFLERNGTYFIRIKKDLQTMIEDSLHEYSHIDSGKYSEILLRHFLGDMKTKSVKVNKKPTKYYSMSMDKYYPSNMAAILDEFEDLDMEEWQ